MIPDEAIIHGNDGKKRVRVTATGKNVEIGTTLIGPNEQVEIVLTDRVRNLVENGRLKAICE